LGDPLAYIDVGGEFTIGANGSVVAAPGSVVHMTHDPNSTIAASFNNLSNTEYTLAGLDSVELSFEGGEALISTVEVGSLDMGPVCGGFPQNFSLATLRVGTAETSAQVTLADAQDNGNRNGSGGSAEALYVDQLIVAENSTLNVNGLHVYYRVLVEDGQIDLYGGTLEQVGPLGDLDEDQTVGLGDLATLLGSYGTTSGVQYLQGDLDGDGDVDLADLSWLLGDYGETCE
jgi:hypothetical protein